MLYTTFTAKNHEYKLRLGAQATVDLEEKLGKNPVNAFLQSMASGAPSLAIMLNVLHASMQRYQHGLSFEDVCGIYDEWIDDGHTMLELGEKIMQLFEDSGLIAKEEGAEEDTEKN